MADVPVPTPSPYVDPQNLAFLESAGEALNGKQLTDLSLRDLRAFIDKFEIPEPTHPDIDVSSFNVGTSPGEVETFFYKPKQASGPLPFVYYLHGGAWILGNASVCSNFIFVLIERANFEIAVVFPQCTLAPEDKFPAQQEQCLDVLQWLFQNGSRQQGLAADNVVVMADSAGGKFITLRRRLDTAVNASDRPACSRDIYPESPAKPQDYPSHTSSCSILCSIAQRLVLACPNSNFKTDPSTAPPSSKKQSPTTFPTGIQPTPINAPASPHRLS